MALAIPEALLFFLQRPPILSLSNGLLSLQFANWLHLTSAFKSGALDRNLCGNYCAPWNT